MTKNLDVSIFRNGDPIPEAKTNEDWIQAIENNQPAWCYYDNNSVNGEKHGKLYNIYAVNDSRGLAPKGWHIPSDSEWTTLIDHLGGATSAGSKMKNKTGWNNSGNGTNESGFSGLPGGKRDNDGKFSTMGKSGCWWSSTEDYTIDFRLHDRLLFYANNLVLGFDGKENGLSVRCIRD